MGKFFALPFPLSKNLVISRRTCAGTAKKSTKKSDARLKTAEVHHMHQTKNFQQTAKLIFLKT